jgi:hypothetical protein
MRMQLAPVIILLSVPKLGFEVTCLTILPPGNANHYYRLYILCCKMVMAGMGDMLKRLHFPDKALGQRAQQRQTRIYRVLCNSTPSCKHKLDISRTYILRPIFRYLSRIQHLGSHHASAKVEVEVEALICLADAGFLCSLHHTSQIRR